RRLEAVCLQTMGEAYQAMAKPEVALGMADEFLRLSRESNDKWIEAYGFACVGELRHMLHRDGESRADLATALGIFEALGSRDQVARVLRIMSQVHEAEGELSLALSCIRRAGAIEQLLRTEETEGRARALAARRRLEAARMETERYKRLAMED